MGPDKDYGSSYVNMGLVGEMWVLLENVGPVTEIWLLMESSLSRWGLDG